MFPQPAEIVSKLCKEGQEQALRLFEDRKRELLEARKAEADTSSLVQQASDGLHMVAAPHQITDPELYISVEYKLMDEFVHRMREKLSIESENKQAKLIQASADRLKPFLSDTCVKYIQAKLKNREMMNFYALRNWKQRGHKAA